jgi:hypothetical protein
MPYAQASHIKASARTKMLFATICRAADQALICIAGGLRTS